MIYYFILLKVLLIVVSLILIKVLLSKLIDLWILLIKKSKFIFDLQERLILWSLKSGLNSAY